MATKITFEELRLKRPLTYAELDEIFALLGGNSIRYLSAMKYLSTRLNNSPTARAYDSRFADLIIALSVRLTCRVSNVVIVHYSNMSNAAITGTIERNGIAVYFEYEWTLSTPASPALGFILGYLSGGVYLPGAYSPPTK